MVKKASFWFLGLPRVVKRTLMKISDALIVLLALFVSFASSSSGKWVDNEIHVLTLLFILLPVCAVLIFSAFGLHNVVIRYISIKLLYKVSLSVLLLTAIFITVDRFYDLSGEAFYGPTIFGLCVWVGVSGSRWSVKNFYQFLNSERTERKNVIIYGAGAPGNTLFESLQGSGSFDVRAFVDDDVAFLNAEIAGVKVYPLSAVASLIEKFSIDTILVALPHLSKTELKAISGHFSGFPINVKSIPSLEDLFKGKALHELQDIPVLELLGRNPVSPDCDLMAHSIFNNVVCVTGAGGSIGSEIARQCLLYGASRIVLIDQSEYALYSVEQKLIEMFDMSDTDCEIITCLGSVLDEVWVSKLLENHSVKTVYHAAAYKHVSLVEKNSATAIHNNVFGTRSIALAAKNCGVNRFVLISTDKAVRPKSIMGISKRISELVVQALAEEKPCECVFSIVRFGNVLGSSGSVVPLFTKQIEKGGPVTVTHEDVTRFFMTIEEATSLVIQAGLLAKGGEVFLLDMGEPVRIVDLAKNMICQHGYTIKSEDNPDGDIEIQFTGLRHGEKLFEELLIGSDSSSTGHPKIFYAREEKLPWDGLEKMLEDLKIAVNLNEIDHINRTVALIIKC